jgi:hypothetical protein
VKTGLGFFRYALLDDETVFSVPGVNLAGLLEEANIDHAFKEFISQARH